MTRSLRRGAIGVALFVAVLAAVPSGIASAHASLESSTPAANSVLETGPSSIVLDFDEDIEVGLASIKLYAGDGSAVELGAPAAGADATAVTASVPTLKNDIYAVIWKVTSADGHAVEGAFSFQVGTGTTGNAQDLLDQVKGGGAATSGLVWFYAIARFLALTGAIVLIGVGLWSLQGRPAIGSQRGTFQLIWDLGDEWCRWTGLPFVFAVWAARRDVDVRNVAPLLSAARDAGRAELAAIAAAEAASHGLTVPQCLSYLRDNLHYDLGPPEREALARFYAHAERLELAPAGFDVAAAIASAV